MSSEIVLKLNVIVLLPPMFINKHSFEVVREKVGVGGQVKLEMPGAKKRRDKRMISAFNMITLSPYTFQNHLIRLTQTTEAVQ